MNIQILPENRLCHRKADGGGHRADVSQPQCNAHHHLNPVQCNARPAQQHEILLSLSYTTDGDIQVV